MMAEGTDPGEMPSFDQNPSFEAKKRRISSDGSECCTGSHTSLLGSLAVQL